MKKKELYLIVDTKTGKIIHGNSPAIDFFFKKGREWKHTNIKHIFKNRNSFIKMLPTITNENNCNETTVSIISSDGKEKMLSVKAKIHSAIPHTTAMLSFSDILSQKSSKNIIQEQNSQKELDNIKYALDKAAIVFITDDKGIVEYVNDNFCAMSMYSREDLIGMTPKILNSGYHTKDFFSTLWNTIKKGETWRGEIKNRKKNGEFYWVDTVIVPLKNKNGKIYQYFSIRYDITSKKEKELLIQQTLKEKELLINEIHNRVKNNLQIICSLINLKRYSLEGFKQDEILADIHGKIISMSLAHDEVYKSENITKIDFKNYISRLELFLSKNYLTTQISFNVTGDSAYIKLDEAINFGIIICEIISNYMKHAFTQEIKSIINIVFVKEKSLFLMKITDNGPGFPETILNGKSTGIGIQLIEGLVLQMKGELKLYNNSGAVYDIKITT